MNILFIGGTGTISLAITQQLLLEGHQVTLLNRGTKTDEVPGAKILIGDINDSAEVEKLLRDKTFDVVADFIAFHKGDVERDYHLFREKTKQYIFISSASAYQSPPTHYLVDEGTTLSNPYWQYSRDKIACEEFLMERYRTRGFPVTIIRPSHTYGDHFVPLAVQGDMGYWQVLKRMLDGKPVIIPGDGTSLWTVTNNRDFAKGFIGLLGNIRAIGEAVQITSDEVLTWTQIYKIIAQLLGVELIPYYIPSDFLAKVTPYNYSGELLGDKAVCAVFDNTKLKNLVPSYCATISFREGVERTLNNILNDPNLQIEDPVFDKYCDTIIAALEETKKKLSC